MQDIVVFVALDTQLSPRKTLLPLILNFEGETPYKEYTGVDAIITDYPGDTSPAGKAARAIFGQALLAGSNIAKVATYGVAVDATPAQVTAALDALRETNDEWYFLLPTVADDEMIHALAAWADKTVLTKEQVIAGQVEAEKLLLVQTAGKTAISNTVKKYKNTVVCHNFDAVNSYLAHAWVGRVAPSYPRVPPWKWKQLAGIPVTEERGTDRHELLEGHYNMYVDNHGEEYMSEGVCTDGDYIDTVISRWQIKELQRENLIKLFVTNEEIGYDDEGFTKVASVLYSAMETAVANGIILTVDGVGAYDLSIPRRVDATTEQVAARIMPNIEWRATLRGGIHGVRVYGTLTVALVSAATA